MTNDINELAAALVKLQPKLVHPKKTSVNPHLKNRFADLNATIDANRGLLAEHGLCIVQSHESCVVDGRQQVSVSTTLLHQSGQHLTSTATVLVESMMRGLNMPQTVGVCVTYLRRYGWLSILGLSGEDDDDGGPQQEKTARKAEPMANKSAEDVYEEFTAKCDAMRAKVDLKMLKFLLHYAKQDDTDLAKHGLQGDAQRYVTPLIREVEEVSKNLEEASS